jgi:hypothetical protein
MWRGPALADVSKDRAAETEVARLEESRRQGRSSGRVEEVVTSRSDRRIDRPLLPELPPSGRRVSGTCRQRLDSAAMLVSAAVGPWTGVQLPIAHGHQPDTSWSLPSRRGHGDWAAGHGPELYFCRPRRCQGGLGRCPGGSAAAHGPCGTSAVRPQAWPDTAAATVRPAVQVRTPRGRSAAPVSPGGCGAYGNRSSGWRPLVGCSQRRWARASRAASRPRSSPRT